jgi:hypothetical protein
LKNNRLLRCAYHSSLRRTEEYASFLMTARALHPIIFEQPVKSTFSKKLHYVLQMNAFVFR